MVEFAKSDEYSRYPVCDENLENTIEEVIDHGVFEYEDTDPKRMMSDLSVDFTFIASTELNEAIKNLKVSVQDPDLARENRPVIFTQEGAPSKVESDSEGPVKASLSQRPTRP